MWGVLLTIFSCGLSYEVLMKYEMVLVILIFSNVGFESIDYIHASTFKFPHGQRTIICHYKFCSEGLLHS